MLPDDILTYAWDQRFTETPPPVGPVRPVAEFEPASHVLIRYPWGYRLHWLPIYPILPGDLPGEQHFPTKYRHQCLQ